MRIEEQTLLLPALSVINDLGEATTSEIRKELEDLFHPTGEDAKKLSGRNDNKFTQIVRNLLGSHYKTNGMADYTEKDKGRNGVLRLSPAGRSFLAENAAVVDSLKRNSARYEYEEIKKVAEKISSAKRKKKTLLFYGEEEMVSEGEGGTRSAKVKKRSAKLREAALEHYRGADGKLRCAVCEFCFEDRYGSLGSDFIEIHHEKPLFQYEDEDFKEYLSAAVERMKPVCSNCHRMLHRNKKEPLSVKELKKTVKEIKARKK